MRKLTLVTGPIASGKSQACSYLRSLAFPVYDCDSRVKELYASRPQLVERIESELGIPFAELRRIFKDESLRLRLESIVYPILLEDIKEWVNSQSADHLFLESAIALEKRQFDGVYDDVLMIMAEHSLRLGRNAATAERDALQRFDISAADYVIYNDGTIQQLNEEIDKYLLEYENRSC